MRNYMLFRSKLFDHWDTWMYYHEGRYYLYYLINNGIGRTNWDGFGVAVSEDGVHYEDQGRVLIQSEKNTCFLGTGAVWKSPDFEESHKFICNYSEHRQTEKGEQQTIFFATSTDLVHWNKLGEDNAFSVDERYYVDAGANCRWDCIYPLEKENVGYYGYFTQIPLIMLVSVSARAMTVFTGAPLLLSRSVWNRITKENWRLRQVPLPAITASII